MRRLLKGAAIAASVVGALFLSVENAFAQASDILAQFDRPGPFRVEVVSVADGFDLTGPHAEIIIAVLKNEDWLARGVKNVVGIPRPVPSFEHKTVR